MAPFNMKEIAKALREMINEDSPNATEALLSGTREAVFREIFVFHYPAFLGKLRGQIPDVSRSEELVCMLIALQQHTEEIVGLLYLTPGRVQELYSSVCRKLNLPEEKELGRIMKRLLKG